MTSFKLLESLGGTGRENVYQADGSELGSRESVERIKGKAVRRVCVCVKRRR